MTQRIVEKIIFYDSSDDEGSESCPHKSVVVTATCDELTLDESMMQDPNALLPISPGDTIESAHTTDNTSKVQGDVSSGAGDFIEDTVGVVSSKRCARQLVQSSSVMPLSRCFNGKSNNSVHDGAVDAASPFDTITARTLDTLMTDDDGSNNKCTTTSRRARRVLHPSEAQNDLKRFRDDDDGACDGEMHRPPMPVIRITPATDTEHHIKGISVAAAKKRLMMAGAGAAALSPAVEGCDTDNGLIGWEGGSDEVSRMLAPALNITSWRPQVPVFATHVVKVTPEGYHLSLDEMDVQEVFEEEEQEEDEEDEEEEAMDVLTMVAAIEKLATACENYLMDDEDGGICPICDDGEDSLPLPTLSSLPVVTPALSGTPPIITEVPITIPNAPPTVNGSHTDQGPYKPRQFTDFPIKVKELFTKMHAEEMTALEVCEALEEDVYLLQKAFVRVNRPKNESITIDGVKMDI